MPKVLSMISVSPRKSLTVPASEDVVRSLGPEEGDKGRGPRPERALTPAHSRDSEVAGKFTSSHGKN